MDLVLDGLTTMNRVALGIYGIVATVLVIVCLWLCFRPSANQDKE